MIALFLGVLFTQQVVASIMQGSLSTAKFGEEATYEILWSGLVVILVLLFKNKYIFTQKREGFFTSFKYILPELLLSCFFIGINIISIILNDNAFDIYSLFNVALYCFFIGIVEEFLCRGWLLNEFLERYSRNRKEVFLSILFSSFIFGVVHFLNIGETQGLFETLVQVMNAAAGGVFLALVYYKTKNIWVVVFSHALWDFSLFLGSVNSMGDCLSAPPTTLTMVINIIRGTLLIIAYGFFCYWLYRQTDLYTKEVKSTKDYFMAIGIAIYVITLLFVHEYGDQNELCPDYTRKIIDSSYRISFYDYNRYSYLNYVLEVDPETGRLCFQNTKTNDSIFLTDNGDYYNYLMVENDHEITIMIQTSNNVLLYGAYSKLDLYDDAFLHMQNQFKKIVVSDINDFGIIDIEGDSYHYPTIRSNIGELYYFDDSDQLYLNK